MPRSTRKILWLPETTWVNENSTAQEFTKSHKRCESLTHSANRLPVEIIAVEGNHSKVTGRKKTHPYRNEDGNINITRGTFYLHHYVYILYVYMNLYISLLCRVFLKKFLSKVFM